MRITNAFRKLLRRIGSPPVVHRLFFRDLIRKTGNFGSTKWLGNPIWQNVMDLWVIQETIAEVKPALLIETGTNKGGSSLFYAHLFDLLHFGEVITIDVERQHNLSHPRITYLLGSSTAPEMVETVRQKAADCKGAIMVILDSDHSQKHVERELECYTPFVTSGSYCLVQDGVIDVLPLLRLDRPGPLPAIHSFLRSNDDFEIDQERSNRFIITHHPSGWLKRK